MVTSKDGNRLIVNKGAFQAAQEVKNLPVNAGDAGSIPGLGKSPGEENGKSLQYSCLGNPMDRGAWLTTVHGVAKSRTWLSIAQRSNLIIYIHLFTQQIFTKSFSMHELTSLQNLKVICF